MEMHIALCSIKMGVINQLIQVFSINETLAGMLYQTEKTCTIDNLENTIQELNKEYPNLYINILNDKEIEDEISKKLNIPKWEER